MTCLVVLVVLTHTTLSTHRHLLNGNARRVVRCIHPTTVFANLCPGFADLACRLEQSIEPRLVVLVVLGCCPGVWNAIVKPCKDHRLHGGDLQTISTKAIDTPSFDIALLPSKILNGDAGNHLEAKPTTSTPINVITTPMLTQTSWATTTGSLQKHD